MPTKVSTKTKQMPGKYVRRAASLFSGVITSYIDDSMSVTTGIAKDIKDTGAELAGTLSTAGQSIIPKLRQIRMQAGYRRITDWFMGRASDFDDGYDDPSQFDTDTDGSDREEVDPLGIQINEMQKNANQVSKVMLETAGKMAEVQTYSTATLAKAIDSNTAAITSGFDRTEQLLKSILEVVTKNTAAIAESNAVIASSSESNEDDYNSKMLGRGRFDLSQYRKMVGTNLKNSELGMAAQLVAGILEDPEQIREFFSAENITKMVFSGFIDKANPKLKENMKALDEAINDTIMSSLLRLGERRGFGAGGILGRIFGLKSDREDFDVGRSNLEVKPVPYDSMSRESLVTVLPAYLRQLVLLNGGPDMTYDFRARSFRTRAAINREFNERSTEAGRYGLQNSRDEIRRSVNDNRFNNMMHELMINYLGTKQANGEYRDIIESMAKDSDYAVEVAKTVLGADYGKNATQAAAKYARQLSRGLSRGENVWTSFGNQVANTTFNRNQAAKAYISESDLYEKDISRADTSWQADADYIRERYGLKKSNRDNDAEISAPYTAMGSSGVSYTNKALYEIYRRLETGINVFKVGESKGSGRVQRAKFDPIDGLLPPENYRPKSQPKPDEKSEDIAKEALREPDRDEEEAIDNGEDTEELTTGDRFAKWGSKRGKQLMGALFNGSASDVKKAFADTMGDIGDYFKDSIVSNSKKPGGIFNNFPGYLDHKLFGSEYDREDENGQLQHVKKGKGLLGFIGDEFHLMFDNAKKSAGDWMKTTASYFNYGDQDEDAATATLKRKIMGGAIGAFAGAGILGGPIGMLVGGLAGSAIAGSGVGGKIKDLLFGHDDKDGRPTGLISKTVDAVVSPIQFQTEKTMAVAGAALQKHVFGPMADVGLALKDRLMNRVDSIFQPVKDAVKGAIGGAAKATGGFIADRVRDLATWSTRASTTMTGKAARAVIRGVLAPIGVVQNATAWLAGSRAFHKLAKDEVYPLFVGQDYYDPTPNKNIDEKSRSRVHRLTMDTDGVRELPGYPGEYGIELNGSDENCWRPRTRDYIKWRRHQRNKDIDDRLRDRGFKGGVKGFFGGEYKEWKKKKWQNDADRRQRFRDAMREETIPYDEWKKEQEEAKKRQDEQLEATKKGSEAVEHMDELASEKGSLFTHDQGIHDRLNRIIELLGGETFDENGTANNSSAELVPLGKNDSAELTNENEEDFTNTMLSTAGTIATIDGVDKRDQENVMAMVDEGAKPNSSIDKMKKRLEDILGRSEEKGKEAEEKKENWLTSLLGGLLSGAGSLITKLLPFLLPLLTLFNEDFRKWLLETALPAAGAWLSKNLPNILKAGLELFTGAAAAVDQLTEALTTDSELKNDPVTNETHVVTPAEEHFHDKMETGSMKTAFETVTNPINIADIFTKTLVERAGVRAISTVGQAGLTAVGGAAGGANAILNLPNTIQGLLGNTIFKGTSKGLALNAAAEQAGTSTASAALTAVEQGAKGGAGFLSGLKSSMKNGVKAFFSPTNFATMGGAMLSTLSFDLGWETTENEKHTAMLGDYGTGNQAGGFVRTGTDVVSLGPIKTTTKGAAEFTAGTIAGIGIGMAIGKSGMALGASLGFSPAGWVIFIISAAITAFAIIGNVINLLVGWYESGSDINYAIRSNSAKLNKVITDKVINYVDGADNPMYVYNGQESDRVLGLDAGVNVKDPEVMIGQLMRQISEQIVSAPGAEVLLYDLINNMAVQGVPFAVYVVGDSKEIRLSGKHANSSTCSPIYTGGNATGAKTQVLKDTVRKNKDIILADIHANIDRQDPSAKWSWDDIKDVYDEGRRTISRLKDCEIIKSNGTINTNKFAKEPGTEDNDGWASLKRIAERHGMYALSQCLIYINSKVEVNKKGEQWLQAHQDQLEKLYELLSDVIEDDYNRAVRSLKEQGYSDEEIEELTKGVKGEEATPAADQTKDTTSAEITNNVANGLPDESNIRKELKYLAATYMYSHPDKLYKWVDKHRKDVSRTGVNIDNVDKIPVWKSAFRGDKAKQKTLRSEMAKAAMNYAEDAGDIYNLIPLFHWQNAYNRALSKKGSSDGPKYGAAYLIRGDKDMKKDGEGTMDKLWEQKDIIAGNKTPEDVHDIMFGEPEHGKGSENRGTYFLGNAGVIGKIANFMTDDELSSSQGARLTVGTEKDKWRNVLINYLSKEPVNLPEINNTDSRTANRSTSSTSSTNKSTTTSSTPAARSTTKSSSVPSRTTSSTLSQTMSYLESIKDPYGIKSSLGLPTVPKIGLGGPMDEDGDALGDENSFHVGMGGPAPEEDTGATVEDYAGTNNPSSASVTVEGGNPLGAGSKISTGEGSAADYGPRWGSFHQGIDLVPTGSDREVRARFYGTLRSTNNAENDRPSGTPLKTGYNNSAGNYVTFTTREGLIIKNFHLKKNSIPQALLNGTETTIYPGMKIGTMGNTGNSSGDHLHYQIDDPKNLYPSLHPGKSGAGDSIDPKPSWRGTTDYSKDGSYDSDSSSGGGFLTGLASGITSSFSNIFNKAGFNLTATEIGENEENNANLATLVGRLQQAGTAAINTILGGILSVGSNDGTNTLTGGAILNRYSFNDFEDYLSYNGTIQSASDFITLCKNELGTVDDGHDNVKYNHWFWGDEEAAYKANGSSRKTRNTPYEDLEWCMAYVQWCFDKAGLKLPIRSASCDGVYKWYMENKPECVIDKSQTPKPGDIILMDTKIKSDNPRVRGHTGIIISATSSTNFEFIEGNSGHDTDGVARVQTRSSSTFSGAGQRTNCFIRAVDFEALEAAMKYKISGGTLSGTISDGTEGLWVALHQMGYNDKSAAGILGAWDPESGHKARKLEGDTNAAKVKEYGGLDALVSTPDLLDKWTYDYLGKKDKSSRYWEGNDGHAAPGIGLAQWTGGRHPRMIKFAKSHGMRWDDPAAQLGFMHSELYDRPDKYYDTATPEKLNQQPSASAAAQEFVRIYEGYTGKYVNRRKELADDYYRKLSGTYNPSTLGTAALGGPDWSDSDDEDFSVIDELERQRGIKEVPDSIIGVQTPKRRDKEPGVGGPVGDDGNETMNMAQISGPSTSVKPKQSTKKKNLGIGGPASNSFHYSTPQKASHSQQPVGGPEDGGSSTAISPSNTQSSGTNTQAILDVLYQVIEHLEGIQKNTGTSNDLLSDINDKDFAGNSDTTKGTVTRRRTSSSTQLGAVRPTTPDNARLISRMVRP